MKKLFVVLLIMLVACGGLFARGTEEMAAADDAVSVAMVTDVGGVNDQSFNQSAWEGLQKAESDLGVKVAYKESRQPSDYGANFETLLDEGYDLIWGIGFMMGDILLEEAQKNPDQKFAIIDYAYGDATPANVLGIEFKEHESSFLMGIVAAMMSETGKIGFVGGMEGYVIGKFEAGFVAGVAYADPDAEVLIQYAESFTDAAKGKSIATNMYQNGCDVVYHAAGSVGDGVIEAAKEQAKWVIGVDRDQNYLAPENVLSSAMKGVGQVMYLVAKDMVEGKGFPGGQTGVYGLAEGGVDYAPTTSKNCPQSVIDALEAAKKKIVAGEIEVPMFP